jgi:hypothetical protein
MSCQIKRLRFVFGLTVIGLLLATGAASRAEDAQQHATLHGKDAMSAMAAASRFEATDVDGLTLESDFSIFMREDCPPDLRKNALQRLWHLLPRNEVPVGDAF